MDLPCWWASASGWKVGRGHREVQTLCDGEPARATMEGGQRPKRRVHCRAPLPKIDDRQTPPNIDSLATFTATNTWALIIPTHWTPFFIVEAAMKRGRALSCRPLCPRHYIRGPYVLLRVSPLFTLRNPHPYSSSSAIDLLNKPSQLLFDHILRTQPP